MQAPKNPNYAATVVSLQDFRDLPNCDNVKAALIFGNQVIVAKDTPVGALGLFFPVETALSPEFCKHNNLYRKADFGNADPTQTGFFEQHGRVRCMKFRGHKSEGFWIPESSLDFIANPQTNLQVGDTFDFIDGVEICRKYVPKGHRTPNATGNNKSTPARLEDSIVEGQFRLHFDTENLRRNISKILPTDLISITDKWHGTSAVIAKVLVKRKLSFVERIAKRLGVAVQEQVYGLTYSSRKVIKAVNGVDRAATHYYSEDIWGVIAKEVHDRIPNGFTLYGEIVGYTSDGAEIQKGYAYGCMPGEHAFVVYRVTFTNVDGKVYELPWPQAREFCEKQGLRVVPTLFYGPATAIYPLHRPLNTHEWQTGLLNTLEDDYANDSDCLYNPKGTPAEGVVVRIDRLAQAEAFKLKNFRFLERETKMLDKGEVDTETAQTEVL